jgi:ribosomal protein L37AE/L43A
MEMIVEEISASIVCSKCDYGFTYSALMTHTKLENVYKDHLKSNLDVCVRCNKGRLTIKDVKCILKCKSPKYIHAITWQCEKCNTKWVQKEYMSRDELLKGNLIKKYKESVVCPRITCASTDKRLIGMSKGKSR